MRFLIQRVKNAKVEVDGQITGSIDNGFLVFIGVKDGDTKEIADTLIRKMLNLRIFADSEGKTNLNISAVDGSLLLVSQFTLYADCRKGNRPSFTTAGAPDLANELYEYIISECRREIKNVGTGIFGADMLVSLSNDGPFTVMLDSDEIIRR